MFPDEFHLVTLSALLKTVCRLAPQVEVKLIITSLIDRLAKFAASSAEGIPAAINVFKIVSTHIQEIVTVSFFCTKNNFLISGTRSFLCRLPFSGSFSYESLPKVLFYPP